MLHACSCIAASSGFPHAQQKSFSLSFVSSLSGLTVMHPGWSGTLCTFLSFENNLYKALSFIHGKEVIDWIYSAQLKHHCSTLKFDSSVNKMRIFLGSHKWCIIEMRRMLYTNESFHQYSTTRHTSQWTLKPFAYPCCFRVLFLNFECERFRGKTTAPLPSGSASRRNVNSSIYGLPLCFSRISSQLKAEITAAAKQCSAHSRLVVMTSITLLIRHVVTQVGPPGLTFSVLHALLAFPIINNEEATELGTGPMNKKTTKKNNKKTLLSRESWWAGFVEVCMSGEREGPGL